MTDDTRLRVLSIQNRVRYTSFAYEVASRIDERTPADVTVVSYADKSVAELEAPVRGRVDVVPLGADSRFDRRAISRLRRLLTTGEYDVLHTHHNFVGALSSVLAPRKLPVVNTEHAHHDYYSAPQTLVNAITLWQSDRVIANSRQTRRSFRTFEQPLLPPEGIDVIYNGVDVDRIDRVRSASTNSYGVDDVRITTACRMVDVKNLSTLIRAYGILAKRVPETRLTLVGDGPERRRLEALVAKFGLNDRVEFTGHVPREDVYQILDASDVFVVPSLMESFCVAAVEAMAFGVPVVASDIEVLREVVSGGGTFADPERPDQFARRIEELLTDEVKYRGLAETGRARARTTFALDRTADEYYRLYEQVTARNGRAKIPYSSSRSTGDGG
ncbi:glycosyltransferase family 1 protein [Natronococcus pandeyae]|uniref:Glycosyltransferase family 1 protein n=1 Tax=Natronococcus pandeyae TaxID=2055836 RepID=A0A8J8Q5D2_9EURY|nr:glycosyltransferase family 4 protein [Natronococcus pandeyae]TYL38883.1 glycosyltransferase family 1 protein [Natronococcus pandeyae]